MVLHPDKPVLSQKYRYVKNAFNADNTAHSLWCMMVQLKSFWLYDGAKAIVIQ